ncbi:MAG TPA: nucleotidyltransferase [Blastocatellia bacterium]|nr:nucleotidyltransferase [Blastocatellia bacterium]HMV83933.1 nucleotidyltransferase [Blastocatellia bacterium]HMX27374.1 nucleotidyltransferase [Blastocatellia bacterium]HMY72072.1 nucleotidyltransferase [Blastocatellia bacterium]HMZ17371.1 nucleotidyltransferase [Blastocatellia bacterium]
MHSDLLDILRVFSQYKVEYLIVGGYAVAFHAEPRFTKDLDIFVRANQENARRVFQALRAFGAPLSGLTEKDFEQEGYWYQIGITPVRVDVLMAIDGVKFEEAWQRKVESSIDDVTAYFISKEDLITTKKAAGRPQDILDVQTLTSS